jgi:hypothetical protein|tara:strand:- start:230 stop:385 length:156 start_codon:yes stop_codon:yes gene_type:complete
LKKGGPLPQSDEPGPGHYTNAFKKSDAGIKIGKENRGSLANKDSKNVPGPG